MVVVDLDVLLVVRKEIFWLEVAMDDAEFVELLDARDDLVQELGGLHLPEALAVHNVLKQLASAQILHHQAELALHVNYLIQLHDVRVLDYLEDVDLPCDPLHIARVRYLVLFEDLYCNLLTRLVVAELVILYL